MHAESILNKERLFSRASNDIFVFLRGGLISGDSYIAQPGDVLDGSTLGRLAKVFDITEEIVLLSISQENTKGTGYGCP